MRRFVLAALFLSAATLTASVSVSAAPLDDLAQMLGTIRADTHERYALEDWKARYLHWNVDAEAAKVFSAARKLPDLTRFEAQRFSWRLIASAKDYHLGAYTSDPKLAELPVGFRSYGSRTFLAYIGPEAKGIPAQLGDEVLTFDGQPVKAARRSVTTLAYRADADSRKADWRLAHRYGYAIDVMPTAPTAKFTVRGADGKVREIELPWQTQSLRPLHLGRGPQYPERFRLGMITPMPTGTNGRRFDRAPNDPSLPTGFVSYLANPPNTEWIATDTKYYQARIGRRADGRRIGVIRIPTFYLKTQEDYEAALEEFSRLLHVMNERTDMLLLDLLGNFGGFHDYVYALLTHLFDKPEPYSLRFRFRLAGPFLEEIAKYDADLQKIHTLADAQKYFGTVYFGRVVDMRLVNDEKKQTALLKADIAAGAKLSRPMFSSFSRITPAKGERYLKPLSVLVDEWSASCADMFPAFLQDSGRASIIGNRSNGAGAFVSSYPIQTALGFTGFSIPIAHALRDYGRTSLENLAVTPDYPVPVTLHDVRNGFPEYSARVYDAVGRRPRRFAGGR